MLFQLVSAHFSNLGDGYYIHYTSEGTKVQITSPKLYSSKVRAPQWCHWLQGGEMRGPFGEACWPVCTGRLSTQTRDGPNSKWETWRRVGVFGYKIKRRPSLPSPAPHFPTMSSLTWTRPQNQQQQSPAVDCSQLPLAAVALTTVSQPLESLPILANFSTWVTKIYKRKKREKEKLS